MLGLDLPLAREQEGRGEKEEEGGKRGLIKARFAEPIEGSRKLGEITVCK